MPDYPSDFERAWNEYPKRDGKRQGKFPAFKAWKKLSEAEKAAARERIDRMNRAQAWGKYIRNMATWINAKGWEDDVSFPRARAAPEAPQAAEPERPLPWYDRVLGRVWLSWCLRAGGVSDATAAIRERDELRKREVPQFTRELEAGNMSKSECAWDLAGLYANRLDRAYGKNLRHSVMRNLQRGNARNAHESNPTNAAQTA